NAKDAIALNNHFNQLTLTSPCQVNENACINGKVAKCDNGAFVIMPCAATLECVALPLVNSRGTSITCDTPKDARSRI
ncbi:hypothetical protein C1645_667985, partial [Glomus cerebriforme]